MVVGVEALQRVYLVTQCDASFGISKDNMIAAARSTRDVDCLHSDRGKSLPLGGSTDCSSDPTTEQCESSRMRTGSTVHTLFLTQGWNDVKHICVLGGIVLETNRITKLLRKTTYDRNDGGTNELGTLDSSTDCSFISPLSAIDTRLSGIIDPLPYHLGVPFVEPQRSIIYTTSIPSNTVPKATSFPSKYATFAYVITSLQSYRCNVELGLIGVSTKVGHHQNAGSVL